MKSNLSNSENRAIESSIGDKAVELILSQGYGKAWEFEPKINNKNNE
jgi:hypothetical protein